MVAPDLHILLQKALPSGAILTIAEVDHTHLATIRDLNLAIFEEHRVINTFERDDLLMLLAYLDGEPIGFKIGYRESRHTFYSAKGGVLQTHRRIGLARTLLYVMIDCARERGYRYFAYDTFPNQHPGMTVLGLAEQFRVVKADYNSVYKDFRLRFELKL